MTDLCLYNTLTRKKERFESIDPKSVRMYTCGPTVYSHAHLGNMRPYVFADVLRRTLEYAGYDVVRYVEDLPNAPEDDRGLPDLSFAFYDRMIVFDNVKKTMDVVVTARIDGDSDVEQAYHEATRRVDDSLSDGCSRGLSDAWS